MNARGNGLASTDVRDLSGPVALAAYWDHCGLGRLAYSYRAATCTPGLSFPLVRVHHALDTCQFSLYLAGQINVSGSSETAGSKRKREPSDRVGIPTESSSGMEDES